MMRLFTFPLALVLAATATAQEPTQQPAGQPQQPAKSRIINAAAPLADRVPFGLQGTAPLSVEIRPASTASEQDRNLEADAESTIRARATLHQLDLENGQWTWQQFVCPVFPGHLLLRYTRNNGAGDVSAFAVSIPRNGLNSGQARIRFIPLIRRGYSLWSPAPINAMTVAAFNHILAEERSATDPSSTDPAVKPDWSAMAVCYAALAGAAGPEATAVTLDRPPVLNLDLNGQAAISFVTIQAHPQEWRMIFDSKGVLKKATHSAAAAEKIEHFQPPASSSQVIPPQTSAPTPQ